jgi:hypothetical protein
VPLQLRPEVASEEEPTSGGARAPQAHAQGAPLPEPGGNRVPAATDPGPVGAVSEPLRQIARPFLLAAAVGVVLVGIAVGWFVWHRTSSLSNLAAAGRIESLAVLPLENLSGDKEQEYFVDGMTDELITDLGKIVALRVISRTSIMHYKGAQAAGRNRSRAECGRSGGGRSAEVRRARADHRPAHPR